MFSKRFVASIVFLGVLGILLCVQSAFAYKTEGVERINSAAALKQADKEGLTISAHERSVKKELQRLKKSNPKEFEKKLAQGLENSSQFQGYLLEIKEGLQKVEKAKKIAKLQLYKKVQADWDILKTSALNTRVDPSFKSFRDKLKVDLQDLYYVKFENGYIFQVGQWGYVTVSKSLNNITWKIEFNSKYDQNRLEEGAEKIQILEDNSPISSEEPESAPEPQEPPRQKSQFEE